MSIMNHDEKKMCEILMANEGCYLSYNWRNKEFVITFVGDNGLRIPGDCDYYDGHILRKNSNKIICKVNHA